MKRVVLVTTKWCPHCPSAKKLWSELKNLYKFDYQEVDATSPEGQKLVERHRIMAVPTTIIDDRIAFIGVPDREKAIQSIK